MVGASIDYRVASVTAVQRNFGVKKGCVCGGGDSLGGGKEIEARRVPMPGSKTRLVIGRKTPASLSFLPSLFRSCPCVRKRTGWGINKECQ